MRYHSRPPHLLPRRAPAAAVAVLMLGALALPAGQAERPSAQRTPVFRSGRDLVVVNVVVRDKSGAPVRGLTRDDFAVFEDNRPQTIESFDLEELDAVTGRLEIADSLLAAAARPAPGAARAPAGEAAKAAEVPAPLPSRPVADLRDRRLMVLFFDLSAMEPDQLARAVQSGRDYVTARLSPADLIGVVTLGASLEVAQDFTSDRALLLAALDQISPVEGPGFAATAAADAESAADTGNAFTADDTEFGIFSTDRRLDALRSLADVLAGVEQKKSVIYFSGGMTRQGMDNQAAMRSVIDRAVRANMSIYAADTRGLQALPAGGEASQASARGSGAFSGQSMRGAFESLSSSQDSLATLAEDTGGRAFFDANEFGEVYDQVVKDTTAYYLLGYTSTNPASDGRYRRIRVALRRPGYKLEHRSGYYAPRDFSHSGRDDREQQLQEHLLSDLSPTDLPVHGLAGYFRLKPNRYFVPMSFIVPGSQVQFSRASDRERATLDVLGVIRDPQQRIVGWIRDTVRLTVAAAEDVRRKNVQYDTSFELPPGRYAVKLVIRENQLGTVGSFETPLVVPDIERQRLKVSSVVLASQRHPAPAKKGVTNPLLRDGQLLTANVARVVTAAQPLYFFFEVYDPAKPGADAPGAVPDARPGPPPATGQPAGPRAPQTGAGAAAPLDAARVLASVACYRGSQRALQTPLVTFDRLNAADRGAVAVQIEIDPGQLPPGPYTCQVNIVDDAAGTFAFPRMPLYVRR
ncbi:MAG TPA: VWA domain-containing protein [Vicinamibacterales bacterium]|nr:VWA domain-containing protein [Vicinamibacterales bacterium]HPW19442.1 VWA domain-containing protein [Vicinamibacterales bacterium]